MQHNVPQVDIELFWKTYICAIHTDTHEKWAFSDT